MLFQFAPAIQAGIAAGKYAQVFTSAGIPIGMARDSVTGNFVANAIGGVVNNSPLSPLVAASQFATSGAQMYQMHRGFTAVQAGLQTLQTSVGVLQATTAVIGVGVATGVALSAVNLYQTLKLRKAVERLELKVDNGFINLEQALNAQGAEIKQLISQIAQDMKFAQHRLVLVKAYGLFTQALHRFRSAMQLQDINRRNAEIDAARGMLFEALADYANPHLLEETCSAGYLRRLECAWAIDQTITATYQVQNELGAVSDRLFHLKDKIREDALTVINRCESEDELDFLFPEIQRIHDHDLAGLNSWQNQTDWMQSLPSDELKLLQSADFHSTNANIGCEQKEIQTALAEPLEQLLYEDLQQKSHPQSLRDHLLFLMEPDLRQEPELYVSQQAAKAGYRTLVPASLQRASDLTVANLYWYFRFRNDENFAASVDECDRPKTAQQANPDNRF